MEGEVPIVPNHIGNPELWNSYVETLDLYLNQVKPAIVRSEILDPESRLSLSAINEIRAAYDHLARAHGAIFGLIDKNEEYALTHIRDARSHLYRAGCDSYELIQLAHRDFIQEALNSLDFESLAIVAGNELLAVIRALEDADSLATKGKLRRDIADGRYNSELMTSYKHAADELEAAKKILLDVIPRVLENLGTNRLLDELRRLFELADLELFLQLTLRSQRVRRISFANLIKLRRLLLQALHTLKLLSIITTGTRGCIEQWNQSLQYCHMF